MNAGQGMDQERMDSSSVSEKVPPDQYLHKHFLSHVGPLDDEHFSKLKPFFPMNYFDSCQDP